MGEGILKDKVPEAHTDYIIAVISEEFGAIFVLFIVIMFLFIGYKVLNRVFAENDEFLKLVLIGILFFNYWSCIFNYFVSSSLQRFIY